MRRLVVLVALPAIALLGTVGVALTHHSGGRLRPVASAGRPPTEAQARALLEAKYRLAQRHDAEAYCADTDARGICLDHWNNRGGDAAVPITRPKVKSSRIDVRYRVLHVCGINGTGEPYVSDFVVDLDPHGSPRAVLAVFWSDIPFHGVFEEGTQPTYASADPHPGPKEAC